MRILIDVNHPAHVHLFRNAAREWEVRGHSVFWTARDKEMVTELLQGYGFEFHVLSTYRRGLVGLASEMVTRDCRLYRLARQLQPDVMLGTSVNITHASKFLRASSIFFTESNPHQIRLISALSFPFADTIVLPDITPSSGWTSKTVRHASYHELAYLHPNRFTADPTVLDELGVEPGEPFFILRYIGWGASHDIGESGLSLEAKRRLVQTLLSHGRVFISSEHPLQPEFEPYRFRIGSHRIHDAMYYATIFVGDSNSMVVEAAVLGTPAFRCNSIVGRMAYADELDYNYDLAYSFLPNEFDRMMLKVEELLQMDNLRYRWHEKRDRMLEDKTDLTTWMVNFVDRYPSSFCEYRNSVRS